MNGIKLTSLLGMSLLLSLGGLEAKKPKSPLKNCQNMQMKVILEEMKSNGYFEKVKAKRAALRKKLETKLFESYVPSAPGVGNSTLSEIGIQFIPQTYSNSPFPVDDPPDTTGAVGEKTYVTALKNGIVSSSKKTGVRDGVIDTTLADFWNLQPGLLPKDSYGYENIVSADPQIRYHTFTERWYLNGFGFAFGLPFFRMLTVSDSKDITPCTKWSIYPVDGSLVPDENGNTGPTNGFFWPATAMDAKALYWGNFDIGYDPVIQGVRPLGYVVQLKSLLNDEPMVITVNRNMGEDTTFQPVPADNLDDKNPPFGYFFGVDVLASGGSSNIIYMWRVANPGSDSPTFSSPIQIEVPTYSAASIAPQKGVYPNDNTLVDAESAVFAPCVIRKNKNSGKYSVYAAHGVSLTQDGLSVDGQNDRNGIRWYEITDLDSTPNVVQVGTIWDDSSSDPKFYFFPAIMASKKGDVTVSCSFSSVNDFVGAVVFRRTQMDPLGTMGPEQLLIEGKNSWVSYRAPGRWGDYSTISADPCDDTQWTIQEYADDYGTYGVQVTHLLGSK